jgi:hypothetical protein
MNFRVNGKNYLMRDAPPALAYLEAGDEVTLTWHADTISSRPYNVVDSLAGVPNADGMTAWEERAAVQGDGASFAPAFDASDAAVPAA